MNNSSFEEVLAHNGRLVYTHVGDSMWPLIRDDKDLLVIVPAEGRLKRFDIPLYRRDTGQVVLHRILKVRESDYIICGDNRWYKETGITDRHIIGKLDAVIRDGKEHPLSGIGYRMYVFLWCRLFPVRVFILKVSYVLKRVFK